MSDYINKCGLNLKESIHRFLEFAVSNPTIEHAWVASLSEIENQAGIQILGNISQNTPEKYKVEIQSHAEDEFRHAQFFKNIQSELPHQDSRDPQLEKLFCDIITTYVCGYFGNPELVKLRNRHAAYVHGAITIEQFPFQTYTVYLDKTNFKLMKAGLPEIIDDEHGHIELGRKMMGDLEESNKHPIGRLHKIERQMTQLLMDRLYTISKEYINNSTISNSSTVFATYWTMALSKHHQYISKHLKIDPKQTKLIDYIGIIKNNETVLQRSVLLNYKKIKKPIVFAELKNFFNKVITQSLKKISQLSSSEDYKNLCFLYVSRTSISKYFSSYILKSNDINTSYAMWYTQVTEVESLLIIKERLESHPDYDQEQVESLTEQIIKSYSSMTNEPIQKKHSVSRSYSSQLSASL